MKGLIISIALCVVISVFSANGQSREDLERNRRELQTSIRLTNNLLKETQKTAETGLNQLVILNNQIRKRQSLIKVLNSEIRLINRQIATHNTELEQLKEELKELKDSYAKMIYYAYRNRSSYQRLMFLFSSQDFNQAYLRLRYLQQYARHRQLQAEKISETSEEINTKVAELQNQKTQQQKLLAEERVEMGLLTSEKEQQKNVLEKLRRKETQLKQQLAEHQESVQALDNAIARIIEEERRKAEERARAEGRPVSREYTLTPEEMELSENFANNKGKLPWPVERGVITAGFGKRNHPVLRGIEIQNNGVDIATVEGAVARAVFDGTVSRVIYVPGSNYSVIVRHGEYLSVYSNLAEVYVQNGERVSTREQIGKVATNAREAKTEVNLQIWHGTNKLNPAAWIARQR